MSLKKWVLGKVNGEVTSPRDARGRRVARPLHPPVGVMREPTVGRDRQAPRDGASHLGPYARVVDAIREALEHFALSQLRLHLAIAERDRYILTSIEVECEGSEDDRALLRRFIAEFKPEQIKQYLARDVIAGLRNASAIDLSQFAGLNADKDESADDPADKDPYEDLIADLRSSAPGGPVSPYEVSLMGRWAPADAPTPANVRVRAGGARSAAAPTPLAAPALALDVQDAAGLRRVEVDAVVPGRRYVVGKDDGCDVVVDGVYASRRHCEIWLDGRTWWVADAGSTNGVRVELDGRVARPQPAATSPVELPYGACIILSAEVRGEADQYPRLTLLPLTPTERDTIVQRGQPTGMATPIAPRIRASGLTIAAHMRSGVCEAWLSEPVLPFLVGRSRNQALVIDGMYGEVSGRHLEIVAVDETGASVVVHGDNGVMVEGKRYACGERFRWNAGEKLVLGRPDPAQPACTLTLAS